MRFLPNILPQGSSRWIMSNSSMANGHIYIRAGGSAYVNISTDDIAYIPNAFQLALRHNKNVNWKQPFIVAYLDITYEDGDILHTLIPLNTSYMLGIEYVTMNVSIVPSKKYSSLRLTLLNTTSTLMDISFYELRPSLDLDPGLQSSVESMLSQIVYQYNETTVSTEAGKEVSVIHLLVSVNGPSTLKLSAHVTGTCIEDILECTVKIDGAVVRAFPVKQSVIAGSFYFGIPSIITYVTKGTHVVQLDMKSSVGKIEIFPEGAMMALEGKNVLGGATGEYPHAETFQTIPFVDFYNHKTNEHSEVLATDLTVPLSQVQSTDIPLFPVPNLTDSAIVILRHFAAPFIFASADGTVPLDPIPDLVYADYTGTKAHTSVLFKSTFTSYDDYAIVETKVDATIFDPLYSTTIQEVYK